MKSHHDSRTIRLARQRLGLTQEQFAQALGIGLSRLQSWEHGRATLKMTHAEMHRFQNLNEEVFNAWVRGDIASVRLTEHSPLHPRPVRRSGRSDDALERDLYVFGFRLCA